MDTHDAIQGRYACRRFTQEQVSGDELEKLLEAANAAPVGMGDYDGFEVVVVRDERLRAAVDAGTAARDVPPCETEALEAMRIISKYRDEEDEEDRLGINARTR